MRPTRCTSTRRKRRSASSTRSCAHGNSFERHVGEPPMGYQPLKGQKALVTGANSGIGAGVALALGAAGADVVVNYVTNPAAAEKIVAEIKSEGSQAIAVRADVSSESDVQAMFGEMLKAFGTIDILVN